MIEVTADMLWQIGRHYLHNESLLNSQHRNMHAIAPHFNHWFTVYSINTELRIAHFLAQACVETANFSAMTETPRNGGLEYDAGTKVGRALGNTNLGDGPKYIGRGLLDLTGRANYQTLSDEFKKLYVTKPEQVANNPYVAVKAACYYWDVRNVNKFADKDDIKNVTLKINGGLNGYSDRKTALRRAKNALGIE
ncbi:family 19 glycoside hydrolase [Buttiauxella brennerae ATCC 51605]|uniref:Family 19 glycoside hydrolase n=1 Tax=Buttiauxella brennerae ATCC 51605 TaxID=1354251 RepID=A0A1B7IRR3_9ENTR|nr:glycoside hydrolase family 19 protein [Buttiauxella brennerae]OAT32460.1 family 19 glycoside hydrolase [Buttiauxella brennerae ATCC 51605]